MNETLRFLNYVFPTDAIVEMRLFTADGTILSGRFDDLAKMDATAQEFDTWPETTAVYFTINPIDPDRQANRRLGPKLHEGEGAVNKRR